MKQCNWGNNKHSRRRGFTLVEMLIVISIILIILGMTVSAVSFTRTKDRVSNEASRIQSFISGAQDRAIYEDEMRGVRLFIEPPPPGGAAGAESRTVASMAYIAPGGTWSSPEHSSGVDVIRIDGFNTGSPDGDFEDANDDLVVGIRGFNNPGWWNLKRRGWLVDGLRIRIPSGPTGHWYRINTRLIDTTTAPTDVQTLLLQTPFADGGNKGQEVAFRDLTYEIELPARILPLEPLLLADGVVVDLDGSRVPNIWRPASTGNGSYSGFMDIWFSPRGNVLGDAAAEGVLHFYVCDSEDSLFLKEQYVDANGLSAFDTIVGTGGGFIPLDEIDPSIATWLTWDGNYLVKDRRLVTLFAQTGAATVNKVNAYLGAGGSTNPDANGDGICDDPYRYAETGEVAK